MIKQIEHQKNKQYITCAGWEIGGLCVNAPVTCPTFNARFAATLTSTWLACHVIVLDSCAVAATSYCAEKIKKVMKICILTQMSVQIEVTKGLFEIQWRYSSNHIAHSACCTHGGELHNLTSSVIEFRRVVWWIQSQPTFEPMCKSSSHFLSFLINLIFYNVLVQLGFSCLCSQGKFHKLFLNWGRKFHNHRRHNLVCKHTWIWKCHIFFPVTPVPLSCNNLKKLLFLR